jgi:hypothetical protein
MSRDSDAVDDETTNYIQSRLKERFGYKQTQEYEAADDIRDELREKYNVSIDDRTREWSVEGGQFTSVDNESRSADPPLFHANVDEEEDAVISGSISEASGEEADLTDLTVIQLKEKLKEAGLPVSGKKSELIERLVEAGQ